MAAMCSISFLRICLSILSVYHRIHFQASQPSLYAPHSMNSLPWLVCKSELSPLPTHVLPSANSNIFFSP
jgi:hypothetical protein